MRILMENEPPQKGDEASLDQGKTWETVTIPRMWLIGGKRTDDVLFRREMKQSQQETFKRWKRYGA